MTNIEKMTRAYTEALYFTETGDRDQPEADAVLTPLCKAHIWTACINFLNAINDLEGVADYDPKQLGHDLWLTRNMHGAGFWDREEIYGVDNAKLFTRMAHAMGAHDAEFEEPTELEKLGKRLEEPTELEKLGKRLEDMGYNLEDLDRDNPYNQGY